MAGKTKHLLERKGRYYARMVVPENLRTEIKKRELTEALDADRRIAERMLPSSLARMHRDLDAARVKIGAARKGRTQPVRGRLMTPQQMAVEHYADQMRFDDEARNADHRYSIGYLDQDYMMIWSRRERNRSSAPVSRRTRGFMANLPAGLSAAVNHASSQP